MKKILFVLLPIVLLCFGYTVITKKSLGNIPVDKITTQRLNLQIKTIKTFITENPKYNQDMAFFIDMKVMSGKNRFFVYNFQKNEIVDQGLVAHGSGSETTIEGELKFSNLNNSYCTSLGKYSIGEKYSGQFGTAYRLTGLDKTNSNAVARSIVLHKYDDVPYEEQSAPIVNSLGCPMVNKVYFERIEKLLDASKKNVLLTIYY